MRRLERMRQHQPFCVYCGGTTPIETIEHIPPISMFDHRFRPEGLEFGACYACNHNSRLDDMALAVVSRSFPDPIGNALMEEARRHIAGLVNNWPELSLEMLPSPRQVQMAQTTDGVVGALDARGPLLNRAMERVGTPAWPGSSFRTNRVDRASGWWCACSLVHELPRTRWTISRRPIAPSRAATNVETGKTYRCRTVQILTACSMTCRPAWVVPSYHRLAILGLGVSLVTMDPVLVA